MSARKVAIQGVRASFHDVAAGQFFQNEALVPIECDTFKKLCDVLEKKHADCAIMAIENTIAGSILTNYSLLERYQFKIFGEVYLKISFAIMALAGQKLSDLRFVQSHPMALFQCEDFLFQHPYLKILEAADTAESAKIISEQKLSKYAAIASQSAAQTYGLEILADGIETNKLNYTRFLAICRKQDYTVAQDANKASIRFETPNEPGSLAEILDILKKWQINMTKIQSVPILGRPYQYGIHIDLEWDDRSSYEKAWEEFSSRALNPLHFGEYKRGMRPVQ